jgi:hypothetical protein
MDDDAVAQLVQRAVLAGAGQDVHLGADVGDQRLAQLADSPRQPAFDDRRVLPRHDQHAERHRAGWYWPAGQDATPGVSVLDGGNLTQVLSIQSKGDITIRHLTIQNALYNGSAGGGAAIAMNGAAPATLAIFDSNVVRNNVDGFASGGLTVFGLGTVHIENNLFTGNSSPAAAAFSTSMNDGSTIYITNNTISANTNTGSNNMITAIGGGGAIGHVSNTVSYGNHGTGAYDFYLYGFEQVDFVHDAYTSITGATAPGSSGNLIGIDPQFVAADNFHLRSTSPLLRAGTLTPAGGLPVVDLEGNPRSVAGFVDIGAYEDTDVIFANGFDPG